MEMNLWFWVVIGGFGVSFLLWCYLFLQYRNSAVAQRPPMPARLEPIGRPQPTPIAAKPGISPMRTIPPTPAPAPAAKPATATAAPVATPAQTPPPTPAPTPAPIPDIKTGQTITGGISPAVVYLQNLKNQLEHLDKEVQGLKTQVSDFAVKHDSQYGSILGRLGELKDELHSQIETQHTAPAPAAPESKKEELPAPALNFGRTPEPAPVEKPVEEPTPILLSMPIEEKPAEVKSAEVQSAAVEPPAEPVAAEPAPAAVAAPTPAPAAEETQRPRRRGPVWPV